MAKKKAFFVTTALSTSGILLCQALEKELGCGLTIYEIDEEETVQKELGDDVECIIISLEAPVDMEDLKNIYRKWRSAWPAMPMIFLIPDTNMEYDFIKGDLDFIFEDEYQNFSDLVMMLSKVIE
ncbi:MAG: hypothetical protein NTZ49_01765 [Candidatus Parcubacteria bacterium]|nr:hypothetical protein [Candidatus Parcubacteria bacterium]